MDESIYGTFPRKELVNGVMVHYRVYSSRARYHGGLFMQHGPLSGRDWLRRLSAEDRKVFSDLGRQHTPDDIHSLGGKARAQKAQRDARGRFAKEEADASDGENTKRSND